MNKYLLLLIIPVLSILTMGCDNEKEDQNEDLTPVDLALLPGIWQIEGQDAWNEFSPDCILDINTKSDNTNAAYGAPCGSIATYPTSGDGRYYHDKIYSWTVTHVENHQPIIELVVRAYLDGPESDEYTSSYRIIKLTDTQMSWQSNAPKDNTIINFRHSILPDI